MGSGRLCLRAQMHVRSLARGSVCIACDGTYVQVCFMEKGV